MKNGRVFFLLLLASLVAGRVRAQLRPIPKQFVTGQAAHLVIGQTSFSDITGGTSETRWGATSGIAIAGNKLIVADTSFLSPPNNNRVLIYNDLAALKARNPQDPMPAADVVLGQLDFASSTAGTSASAFNQPVGVATDGTRLFIADWGNNRVLIYNSIPGTNSASADVVLGQPNFTSGTAATSASGMRRPNGVFSDGVRLFVADSQNNRVLIYNHIPSTSGAPADVVIGQPNFTSSQPLPTGAGTMYSPMSATSDGQRLIVTDLANNRVLIYNSIPGQTGTPADVVVGQPDFTSNGPGNTQTNLNFPRYAYSDGTRLLIVDSGNNRILIYNQIPTQNGAPADIVIGQNDFFGLMESCAASNFAVPYAVASDGNLLYVSDSLNRRVLAFQPGPSLISTYGAVNAASFSTMPQTQACQITLPQPPVAPGSIVSIFGNDLADAPAQASTLPLPTTLGGVRVKFNGMEAPLFFVSPTQINLQVPFELTGYSASVEIEKDTPNGTVVSAASPVGVANGAPGIFTQDGSGAGAGVVTHSDGSPVTTDNPAKPGETVTLYATGLGTVTNVMQDGAPATFGAQGSVTIGGTPGTGQQATIFIQGVPYTYTTVSGDSLDQVTSGLATLINNNDPLVFASADIANEKVNVTARTPGDSGLSITLSASVPPGGTLTTTVNNPIAVPGNVHFSGTVAADQIITITLGGTNYTYVTTASDTLETVLNNLAGQISQDVNVNATADVPDSLIHLDLKDSASGLTVTYTVDVEPAGVSLSAVTDSTHLTPGTAPVSNTVTAFIGKGLPLVPGSVLFGGTATPAQTVTVTLNTTPYSYTTVPGDTLETIINNLTAAINGDPNVSATADLTNFKISLALRTGHSADKITFNATASNGSDILVAAQSTTNSGSESASVTFAGLVPGSVGLYQVNFTVPTDAAADPAANLSIQQNLIVFGSVTSTNIISNYVTFPIGTQ